MKAYGRFESGQCCSTLDVLDTFAESRDREKKQRPLSPQAGQLGSRSIYFKCPQNMRRLLYSYHLEWIPCERTPDG